MTRLPVLPRTTDSRPDAELLGRFADCGDEAAFAELLRRYGGLVWAVCRRLAPDSHAAEDAFQATFLVLVRRSGAVRSGSAAAFLHGVARRVAIRCRRRTSEPLAEVATDADPLFLAMRREEAEVLHAELARLPASVREVLLLCDLGGLSRADAADRLGWSEGAVKGRLERGRRRLADRLAKRGIVGGLVVATAAPAELSASVGRAAVAVWLGGPVPAGLAGLVRVGLPWAVGWRAVAGLLAVGLVTAVMADARPVDPPPATKLDPRAILDTAAATLERSTAEAVERAAAHFQIADGYRRLGDTTRAREHLAKAKAGYQSRPKRNDTDSIHLGRGYARLGDVESIAALLGALPAGDGKERAAVVREAARAAASAGYPSEADRIAAWEADKNTRDYLLTINQTLGVVWLAEHKGMNAALEAAAAIVDERVRLGALVGDPSPWSLVEFVPFPHSRTDNGILTVRLRAGDRAGAERAFAQANELISPFPTGYPDPRSGITRHHLIDRRHSGLAAVACAAARLGDLPRCRALVRELAAEPPLGPDETHVRLATSYLTVAEVMAGNDASALQTAEAAPAADRAFLLANIGLAQVRAGRRQEGVATVRRAVAVNNAKPTNISTLMVGLALGLVGDLDESVRVWAKTSSE